jgi:hypothetical protein
MLSQGHMGATLIPLHRQVGPRSGNLRSLVECKNDAIMSQLRLISTSDCFPHPHQIYTKCLSSGMLSQGHMVAFLYRYTGQVGPRFGDSVSLVE